MPVFKPGLPLILATTRSTSMNERDCMRILHLIPRWLAIYISAGQDNLRLLACSRC